MSCKCSLCSECMQKAMSAIHMLGSIEERIIVKNKAIQELESKVEALEETVQLQHISMVTAQTYSNHIETENKRLRSVLKEIALSLTYEAFGLSPKEYAAQALLKGVEK